MASERVKAQLDRILADCAKKLNFKEFDVFPNINSQRGDGIFSDFFTGSVVNKETNEAVKIAIKIEPEIKLRSEYKTMFTNEVHFYTKVFPELNKFQLEQGVKEPYDNIPDFLSGSYEEGNRYVAMRYMDDYRLHDKEQYFDKKHVEFVLKTYGKFHALSFTFKHKNPDRWNELKKTFLDAAEHLPHDMFMDSFIQTVDSFDPVKEADIIERLMKLEHPSSGFREKYHGKYSCLRHGDCWSGNDFFKYKDNGELIDMKLLDYQLTNEGTPIHDLSYFFYSATSKEEIDKVDQYLEVYYKSFSDFCKELGGDPEVIFPFKVLKDEWKVYSGYGIYIGVHIWPAKLMKKEDLVDLLHQDIPAESPLWKERMDKVRNDPECRKRSKNICLHAIEYGIV